MKAFASRLFIVASNSFKEGLRKKFLLFLAAICFLALCMSLLLGQLSLNEQTRLTINFGLAAAQISLIVLAVFLGNNFISGDLEKKILLTIFVRPVSPTLFFLGRYIGLSLILFVSVLTFIIMLLGFFMALSIPVTPTIFVAFFGLYLESLLILAFVLFFASYSNSFLVLCGSISIFIIGHFLNSLTYFAKDIHGLGVFILKLPIYFFPNLERVNWKAAVVYGDRLNFAEVASSSLYICFWIVFILSISCIIFENRDYQ